METFLAVLVCVGALLFCAALIFTLEYYRYVAKHKPIPKLLEHNWAKTWLYYTLGATALYFLVWGILYII